MRPRSLEIEGLHSFKELVHIDFESLGRAGLFGIFGPTGSGKSTVLDAITLALFGKVTRAGHGTQGILNVACEKLRVCFVFDMLKEKTRKTYKIERIYARNKGKDNSCMAKVARLIQMGEEDTPLCDKPREVNSKVEELLGLTHDDFIRAVVLPQNKFQEFLLLDPSKKSEMLERIFYLEEYGKALNEKITRKKAHLESLLREADGKLQLLQEGSDEGVKVAQEKLESAQNLKDKTQKSFNEGEIHFKTAKEVWDLTCEKIQAQEKQKIHVIKKGEIESLKIKVKRSQEADQLKDILLQFKKDQESFEKMEEEIRAIYSTLNQLVERKDKFNLDWETIEKELETNRPIFLDKKAKLSSGLELQLHTKTLEKRREEKIVEFKKLQKEKQEIDFSAKKAQDKIVIFESEVKEILIKIDGLKVEITYKNKIIELLREEEELNGTRKRLEEEEKTYHEYLRKIKEGTKSHQEITKRLENLNHEEQDIQKKMGVLEKLFEENQAYFLAQKLKEGNKCPVCGSLDHPEPFSGKEVQGFNLLEPEMNGHEEQVLHELKEALKSNQQRILENKTLASRLEGEIYTHTRSCEDIGRKLKETSGDLDKRWEVYSMFLKENRIMSAKEEYQEISKKEKDVENFRSLYLKKQEEIKIQDHEMKKFQLSLNDILSKLSAVETEGRSYREQMDENYGRILQISESGDLEGEIKKIEDLLNSMIQREKDFKERLKRITEEWSKALDQKNVLNTKREMVQKNLGSQKERIQKEIVIKGFADVDDCLEALLSEESISEMEKEIQNYEQEDSNGKAHLKILEAKLKERTITEDEWKDVKEKQEILLTERDEAFGHFEVQKNMLTLLQEKNKEWKIVKDEFSELRNKKDLVEQLQKVFRGNNFIDFVSEERLRYIAREASETLGLLSRYRYTLQIDSQKEFVIRDDFNGGVHRLVTSLSGGETFLTALSLALALSKHVQLKGQSPLEFFFLDEGFGTLDSSLLDTIMDALLKLSSQDRMIGLITHVPELKHRIETRLMVSPPSATNGNGSSVFVEGVV
jgi:DNA repair protein SbcC/Rad50